MSSRSAGFRSVLFVFLAVAIMVPMGSLAQGDGEPAEVTPQVINMVNQKFEPQVAMVEVNQTVNWANGDSFGHDVIGIGNNLSSGPTGGIASGQTFTASFDTPGVYDYYCRAHTTGDPRGEQAMWGRLIVVEPPLVQMAGAGGVENPEHFGVRWLAHWVGIISFVAVVAVLLIYYFVLKYGETVHATDHRDRKEK